MHHQKLVIVFVGFVLILLITACGYRFAGSEAPPKGINRIFIELLENKTLETGVELLITDELKNEFIRKYKGILTNKADAQAVLSGVVTGVRSWTVSRRSALSPLERRVSLTIDLILKDPNLATIWSAKEVSVNDTYLVVSGDAQATRLNKQETIAFLSKQIAETSFNRLLEDF